MPSMIALLFAIFFAPQPVAAAATTSWTVEVSQVAKLTVKYDAGAVSIIQVERQTLPAPKRLRRWTGQYEARVGDGKKTLDYVRFDFPLLAPAESADAMGDEAVQMGKRMREHVTATTTVEVPLPPGAATVSIFDGATQREVMTQLDATAARPAKAATAARPATGGGADTRK